MATCSWDCAQRVSNAFRKAVRNSSGAIFSVRLRISGASSGEVEATNSSTASKRWRSVCLSRFNMASLISLRGSIFFESGINVVESRTTSPVAASLWRIVVEAGREPKFRSWGRVSQNRSTAKPARKATSAAVALTMDFRLMSRAPTSRPAFQQAILLLLRQAGVLNPGHRSGFIGLEPAPSEIFHLVEALVFVTDCFCPRGRKIRKGMAELAYIRADGGFARTTGRQALEPGPGSCRIAS